MRQNYDKGGGGWGGGDGEVFIIDRYLIHEVAIALFVSGSENFISTKIYSNDYPARELLTSIDPKTLYLLYYSIH